MVYICAGSQFTAKAISRLKHQDLRSAVLLMLGNKACIFVAKRQLRPQELKINHPDIFGNIFSEQTCGTD